MTEPNAEELKAINRRLRALGITPNQLTLRPLDHEQIRVEGVFLERLNAEYGPKLGAEAVYRTFGVSMDLDEAWAALDKLAPGWSRES